MARVKLKKKRSILGVNRYKVSKGKKKVGTVGVKVNKKANRVGVGVSGYVRKKNTATAAKGLKKAVRKHGGANKQVVGGASNLNQMRTMKKAGLRQSKLSKASRAAGGSISVYKGTVPSRPRAVAQQAGKHLKIGGFLVRHAGKF